MADARGGTRFAVEPDFASRQAVISAVGLLVLAAFFGLLAQLLLLLPGFGEGLGFLGYGRIRAVADTLLVWGWLGLASMAATFAIVPRVAMAQLHNEILGGTTVVLWTLTIFAGVGALLIGPIPFGDDLVGGNQGRALAELPIGLDAGLVLLLVLVAYNAAVTLARRRERAIFVSGWYLLAAAVLLPIVFVVGNVPVFGGVIDAVVSGFYLNAIEFLWLVPVGLGIAYYVVPVDTGNPVHSMRLARIGFWTLVFAGGWAGARHTVGGPVPDYLGAIGVAMTFVLLVPVLSAVANLYATAEGRWGLVGDAFGLRWAAVGLAGLVAWTGAIAVSSVPQVARIVGLTSWGAGLRHLAFWGVFSAFAFAFVYRVYPLQVGRAWYSTSLASFHFWATVIGVGAGTVLLLAAGIFEGTLAQAAARFGAEGAFDDAIQFGVVAGRWFRAAVALSFAVLAAGQVAFAFNAFRTARTGPPVHVSYAPATVRSAT